MVIIDPFSGAVIKSIMTFSLNHLSYTAVPLKSRNSNSNRWLIIIIIKKHIYLASLPIISQAKSTLLTHTHRCIQYLKETEVRYITQQPVRYVNM